MSKTDTDTILFKSRCKCCSIFFIIKLKVPFILPDSRFSRSDITMWAQKQLFQSSPIYIISIQGRNDFGNRATGIQRTSVKK